MKSKQRQYSEGLAVLALLCWATLSNAETDHERLAELKQYYGVKDVEAPRDVAQDITLNEGAELGGFVVAGWRYAPASKGVEYRLIRKGGAELVANATVRVYPSARLAIEDTLLTWGEGYAQRPKRGHHQGKGDVGDFSLFSGRTLNIVRRNVHILLVARSAEEVELTLLGHVFSEEIDRRALLWGKKEIDAPSLKVAFDRVPQINGGYEVVVTVSVPDGVEHAWKVFSTEGQVETGDKRAVVRIGQGQKRPDIRAVVTTRSGYVLEQRFPEGEGAGPIELRLSCGKSYVVGEPILVLVEAENMSDRPAQIKDLSGGWANEHVLNFDIRGPQGKRKPYVGGGLYMDHYSS